MKQTVGRCFRRFLRCQCFANAFVACASHSKSAARSTTSTAAKYLGAFGAGFPSGNSNLAAISAGISCSCTPRSTDVSVVFKRAGKRRQFSKASFSCGVAADRLANICVLSVRPPMHSPTTTDATNSLDQRTELSAKSPAVPSNRDQK